MNKTQDSRVRVKICGLKSVETAEAVGRMNPDLVGFVFAASKRRVSPELAGDMIRTLKAAGSKAMSAGVFVNPTLTELEEAMASAPLDVIQLHGTETPEFCERVKARFAGILVYKVFPVSAQDNISEQLDAYCHTIDAIMLDTIGGGTGKTFEWECIPKYSAYAGSIGLPLIVAGGLNPDNVEDLVKSYRPDGVDVSSGVETDGIKDLNKISAFIERVKSVDQQRT